MPALPSPLRAPWNVSTPHGGDREVAFLPQAHTKACGRASIWLVGWICHWEEKNLIFCFFFLSSLFTCCPAGSNQDSVVLLVCLIHPRPLPPPPSALSPVCPSLSFSLTALFLSPSFPVSVALCLPPPERTPTDTLRFISVPLQGLPSRDTGCLVPGHVCSGCLPCPSFQPTVLLPEESQEGMCQLPS